MTLNKMTRDELAGYLAQTLSVDQYQDYCPNGLQVEGRDHIGVVISGVTASEALIDAAIAHGADALLVHHGYFWKGERASIVGMKQRRLKKLLENNINLFAYHLPLDGHAELGNNVQLARQLDLQGVPAFGHGNLGYLGKSVNPAVRTVGELAALIEQRLHRQPLVIGDPNQLLGQIGWCTGGAQSMIEEAHAAGATVYMSGEISEPTVHFARENGMVYISAGHHATERYGVQALGAHLAERFGLQHTFIDIDNPV
jgi:dinuclear metal center YbgI/SA1388 family protein